MPLIGALGIAALWVMLALYRDQGFPAFAFVVALDLVVMVRLARLPRGRERGLIAAAGTLLAIAIALWWMLSARVGLLLGMLPWEGITLMRPGFAWTLAQMSIAPIDWLMFAAAAVLAGIFGR